MMYIPFPECIRWGLGSEFSLEHALAIGYLPLGEDLHLLEADAEVLQLLGPQKAPASVGQIEAQTKQVKRRWGVKLEMKDAATGIGLVLIGANVAACWDMAFAFIGAAVGAAVWIGLQLLKASRL